MTRLRLDSEVLEGLFLAHGDAMVRYFARRTFDLEASFDLVSETFAQAVESQRRFRGGTREEAVGWLYGIARHQLSQYIRCGHVERRAMQRLGLTKVRAFGEDGSGRTIARLGGTAAEDAPAPLTREQAQAAGDLSGFAGAYDPPTKTTVDGKELSGPPPEQGKNFVCTQDATETLRCTTR